MDAVQKLLMVGARKQCGFVLSDSSVIQHLQKMQPDVNSYFSLISLKFFQIRKDVPFEEALTLELRFDTHSPLWKFMEFKEAQLLLRYIQNFS